MKTCPGCGRTLPESAYGKDRYRVDGLRTYCKDCRNTAEAERWRANHPEAKTRRRRFFAPSEVLPAGTSSAKRRCVRCGTVLSSYSTGDVCMPCEDREIAALVDREIEEAMAIAEAERRRMERYALVAHE